jgi:uncharacterized protein YndB with AHSA1/START domain
MTELSGAVIHGMFTIERTYKAAPARVYAAFATEEGKEAWFSGPNESWDRIDRAFDFQVGGEERLAGRWKNGTVSEMRLRYFDIVPERRIVYVYEMIIDGVKISVSLATLEIRPEGAGSKLIITEHGAYLDGYDDSGSREHGTNMIIDRLDALLND